MVFLHAAVSRSRAGLLIVPITFGCAQRPDPIAPAAVEAPAPPAPAAPAPAAAASPPEAAEEPTAEASTESLTRDVPSACAPGAPSCTPPTAFAQKVCRGKYPELALYLFSRGTPWQRLYVKAEHVDPVNVYDGERSSRWLGFGEEVLVLREGISGSSKVAVSGPTDVDILRWDGTCATIRKEMFVAYVPGPMTSVRIVWKYLDADVQEALLTDELVARAQAAERKACRNSSVKHPSDACDKEMKRLTDVIVLALKRQKGVVLPLPEARPEWKP